VGWLRESQIWDWRCRKNEPGGSRFVRVLAQEVIEGGRREAIDPLGGLAVVAAVVRFDALLGLAAVEPDKACDGGGLEGAFLFGGAFAAHGWMVAGGPVGFEAVLRLRRRCGLCGAWRMAIGGEDGAGEFQRVPARYGGADGRGGGQRRDAGGDPAWARRRGGDVGGGVRGVGGDDAPAAEPSECGLVVGFGGRGGLRVADYNWRITGSFNLIEIRNCRSVYNQYK
jgi:hypothetical protein